MADDARRAMATWLGTLARGGILRSSHEEAGVAVAAWVVGEERLGALRDHLAHQPEDVVTREQRGAIEVCIAMAHADRKIDPEETHLLRQIVLESQLADDVRDELVEAAHDPPSLDGIEARVTHPVLRELLLALSWELATADGIVDVREQAFHSSLAARLGVPEDRADEIRDAVVERLSAT